MPITPTELRSDGGGLCLEEALPSHLWVVDEEILLGVEMAVVVIYTPQSIHDTMVIAVEVRIPQSCSVLFLW